MQYYVADLARVDVEAADPSQFSTEVCEGHWRMPTMEIDLQIKGLGVGNGILHLLGYQALDIAHYPFGLASKALTTIKRFPYTPAL